MKKYYVLWAGDSRSLWFSTFDKKEAVIACESADIPCDVCIIEKKQYKTILSNLARSKNIFAQRDGRKP